MNDNIKKELNKKFGVDNSRDQTFQMKDNDELFDLNSFIDESVRSLDPDEIKRKRYEKIQNSIKQHPKIIEESADIVEEDIKKQHEILENCCSIDKYTLDSALEKMSAIIKSGFIEKGENMNYNNINDKIGMKTSDIKCEVQQETLKTLCDKISTSLDQAYSVASFIERNLFIDENSKLNIPRDNPKPDEKCMQISLANISQASYDLLNLLESIAGRICS